MYYVKVRAARAIPEGLLMKKGNRHPWMSVALALMLAVAAAGTANAGLFGLFGGKKKVKPTKVVRQTLVVFPFDHGGVTNLPEGFGEYIASDVRSMLAGNPQYAPCLYRDRLSPVRRALEDNTLKAPDAAPPYAEDKAKSLTLARLLASELYLVGAIDDYQVDAAKKVAQMTLRGDLYDAKTGKLVKTLLVTGETSGSAKASDEDELRDLAKGAVVTKLVAELTTAPAPVEEVESAPAPQPSE